MRTTVEIPDALYRQVRALAIERGQRGFSPIVAEALREYLADQGRRREISAAIGAADGVWDDGDVEQLERATAEAWSSWRTDRS